MAQNPFEPQLPAPGGPVDTISVPTVYGYSGEVRSLEWTQDEVADTTEIRIVHYETGVTEDLVASNSPLAWTPQRVGHYVFSARSCNEEGCSEWLNSIDDYQWWFFAWIAPPSF